MFKEVLKCSKGNVKTSLAGSFWHPDYCVVGLNFHLLSHKNKHECSICEKQFSLEIMLKNHMATHAAEKESIHGCEEKGCDVVTQEQLIRHKNTAHCAENCPPEVSAYDDETEDEADKEKEEEKRETETPPAKSFTCAKCDTAFTEFEQLKEHLETHEESNKNAEPVEQGGGEPLAKEETERVETPMESERVETPMESKDCFTTSPSITTTNITPEGTSMEVLQSW